MTVGMSMLGIGIAAIALIVGCAVWYLAVPLFANEKRREDRGEKRIAHQPWHSAGERANR